MATLTINIESINSARQDLLNTRRSINDINTVIAHNTREIRLNENADRAALATKNQSLMVERTLLRAARESTSIKIAGLQMEQRALNATLRQRQQAAREQERINRQEIAANNRRFAARQQFLTETSFILSRVNRGLLDLVGNFVSSAADLETFANTLNVAEGNAAAGAEALERLLQITVDLVGIDTSDLIAFYSRLRLAGAEAEAAEVLIRGATEAVAEQGKSVAVTRRVLEQLTQAYQSQAIVAQDFRPILRELPTLYEDASRALGQTVVDLESFRAAAEAFGGIRPAIVAVFTEIERRSEGASLGTFNAQLEQLRDQLFVLSTEIGNELLPTLVELLRGANDAVRTFRELPPAVRGVIAIGSVAATGFTTLTLAVSATTVAVSSLNASLFTLTGASGIAGVTAGFARILPFLGTAGLIAGGAIAAAYAISRIADISNPGIVRVTENLSGTEQQLMDIAEQARATGEAIQRVSQAQASAIAALPGTISLDAPTFDAVRRGAQETGRGIIIEPDVVAPTAPIENLALSLAMAESALQNYQDAFSAAMNVSDSEAALRGVIASLNQEQRVRTAIATQTIEDEQELEAELFRIRSDFARDRSRATQQHQERIRNQYDLTTRFRIQRAERARDVELQAFSAASTAGAEYASVLRSIADVQGRQRFVRTIERLQDQGLTFQQAFTEAQRYLSIFQTFIPTVGSADAQFGRFNETLQRNVESQTTAAVSLRYVANLINSVGSALDEQTFRLNSLIELNDLREQQYFQRFPGRDAIGEDQQRAREQGFNFLVRSGQRSLREYQRSVQRVERITDAAVSRIGGRLADSLVNVLTDGTASLEDFGREFLAFSARILLQTGIEIAQQRVLQRELARTNALRTAGLLSSVSNPASALGLATIIFPQLGQLGGQIFHNPISDAIAGRGGRQSARFLEADLQTQVQNGEDFTQYFTQDFFRDFSRLGLAAGASAAATQESDGNQPTIINAIFQLDDGSLIRMDDRLQIIKDQQR